MPSWQLWEEEIRDFPVGGGGALLWVVRREGEDQDAPLRLLFRWAWGEPDQPAPPLNRLLQVVRTGEAQLIPWPGSAGTPEAVREAAPDRSPAVPAGRPVRPSRQRQGNQSRPLLWLEPLRSRGGEAGAFALWFDDLPPWGEAVRLWGARFAARTGPLLRVLPSWPRAGGGGRILGFAGPDQPSLFPAGLLSVPAAAAGPRGRNRPGLPLPRPLFVPGVPGAVGVSRELLECCAAVGKIAASCVNVLLHGESGTGKEIIARAVHLASNRWDGPFVGQNCAALPESLFESELFGHKSGAFTGAAGDKVGLLESANGGTFFLDEIGDMPLALQIKLLRVMQERQVRRLGELQSRPVDIRFVAATHQDLHREIEAGRFRLDLYYRLNVVRLTIPPLRRRPEDISHLLAYFLRKQRPQAGCPRITEAALAALQGYRWPGNVRELENEANRFLALYPEEPLLRLRHLSDEVITAAGRSVDPADLATLRRLDEAGELLERYLIRKAIAATGGRKAAAARRLGLSRQGLYKKIQRYRMSDLVRDGQN